jgi:hypothetical protein
VECTNFKEPAWKGCCAEKVPCILLFVFNFVAVKFEISVLGSLVYRVPNTRVCGNSSEPKLLKSENGWGIHQELGNDKIRKSCRE